MNRNAYFAELTQLLYYMTPWDRDATIAKYKQLFDEAEDPDALVREIGRPMKLAVTLSRTYEASPEPQEAGTAEPLPEPMPESADVYPEMETEAVSISSQESEPPEEQVEPAEVSGEDEAETAPLQNSVTEAPPVPEPPDRAPAEEGKIQEMPQEPAVPAEAGETLPAHEEIFSEIFNAATQAQSAIFPAVEETETPVVKKPRMGFLIPYIIVSVIIDIPVSIILFAVDLLIFGIAVVTLVFGVYILQFLGSAQFGGVGDKLVIMGVFILAVTASLAVGALGVWFLRNAAIGFTEFLIRFGRAHGYHEEETP